METADRFVSWLANNEAVAIALFVVYMALLILCIGKLLATRIHITRPSQDDEHAEHGFI